MILGVEMKVSELTVAMETSRHHDFVYLFWHVEHNDLGMI